ncbi:hypothetical protein LAV76_23260 [Bacillus paramobilis]|uniref:hypothetical protein n=1 Tax=Bacillus paramobilis TaxID=2817477 RepID=UPI0030C9A9DD
MNQSINCHFSKTSMRRRDTKNCDERAEKLQSIVHPDEESRRTGSSWMCCSFS